MLTALTLKNFRSYTHARFVFSPASTLIRGPNTAGKTNILEAIMLCAAGKSFRAKRESEMVRWGSQSAAVTGQLSDEHTAEKLEVIVNGATKRYKVNGIARRQIDFVGNLRAVLFWPEDLELITDSPSLRRKYLDSVLIQTDREYGRNVLSYERGLRQRNRLLDAIRDGKAGINQLLFWNQLLIRAGSAITDARARFLDAINTLQISDTIYRAGYDKSVISEERLRMYADEEIAAATTLVGPHRDDFIVTEEKGKTSLDLSRYGSRGEQRLAVLWLKYAELSYVEQVTEMRPILLLDDVFSELDPTHRQLVLGIIKKQQTIITSADPEITHELKKVIHEIIDL